MMCSAARKSYQAIAVGLPVNAKQKATLPRPGDVDRNTQAGARELGESRTPWSGRYPVDYYKDYFRSGGLA